MIKKKSNTLISLIYIIFLFCSCTSNSNGSKQKKSKKDVESQKSIPNTGPYYYSHYKPEDVSLDLVSEIEVDEVTAITILANSCNVFKADYLNYLKEMYGHTSPELDERDLYLEAEHFGEFIIWKFLKKETNCFSEFFTSSDIFFNGKSEPARVMYVNGVLKAMYDEGLRYRVYIYDEFDPWFSYHTKVTWNLMIKDIEGSI